MLEIRTNIEQAIPEISEALGLILNPDQMLRTIATSITPVLRKRVHEDGLDASGKGIGTYNPEYLKQRISKYNRTADRKIVLSLTRQMENDMKPIPLPSGDGWGIGYSNPFNYEKAIANERRENVAILTALTDDEDKMVDEIAEDYVNDLINKLNNA